MELGTPTVTARWDPERARRTTGSEPESLTLLKLLDFRSSTTVSAASGCDASVPQYTPGIVAAAAVKEERERRAATRMGSSVAIWRREE